MPSYRPLDGEQGYRDGRRRALAFALLSLLMAFALASAFGSHVGDGLERGESLDLLRKVAGGGRRFTAMHVPWLVLVGVGAGLFAGMLGMGGGVIKVAGLLLVFQIDIVLARVVSITTMFIATATAARVHIQRGAVLWQVVRRMLVPSVTGVVAGLGLGTILPRASLEPIFAFFVLFLSFNMLAMTFDDPHEMHLAGPYPETLVGTRALLCSGIGGLHGFVCGLLGVSGGVITLPMLQTLARVPAHNAAANSIVVSAVCTTVGSAIAVTIGLLRDDFPVSDVVLGTVCIGGGAVLGASAGAHLSRRVPAQWLKLAFVALSFIAGVSILVR